MSEENRRAAVRKRPWRSAVLTSPDAESERAASLQDIER
jgi:hypothetical protein